MQRKARFLRRLRAEYEALREESFKLIHVDRRMRREHEHMFAGANEAITRLENYFFHDEYGWPDKQVIHHPRQITSIEEVLVGNKYRVVNIVGRISTQVGTAVEVVPERTLKDGTSVLESGYITMSAIRNGRPREFKAYLSTVGIIPSDNGKWNPANYLLPAAARPSRSSKPIHLDSLK